MELDKKTKIKFNIIAIISIIIFAFAISPKTLQNDTYYTIEIGKYVLENGITMQDPFSWHELSYTFPHWAYDVMIYLIYNIGGHLGIYISTIVFAAILGIVMYITTDKLTKNKPLSFIFTIIGMFLIKSYIAARAQLVTFILFELELLFIESFLDTKKKRYVVGLVIIPILLANLHVAVFPFYFVLYLPYIAEYLISLLAKFIRRMQEKRIISLNKKIEQCTDEEKIKKLNKKLQKIEQKSNKENKEPYKITITHKKTTKWLILIMIICVFTGLVTPLKEVPYTYLIKTMQGDSTKNISEHLPLTLANNIKYACVLISFIAIMMFTDTKIRLCDLFMLGGLTVLAFMSRRQESMFIIICLPIFVRLITAFLNKYDKNAITKLTKTMTSVCGMIVTICLILIASMFMYNTRYKDEYVSPSSYPVQASNWILENLDINEIKLYNEYNFGSYLLHRGIPVFIDSRADLYLPEFNKGVSIFRDFLNISGLSTKNLEGVFDKYGFTHFIVNSKAKLTIYLDAKPDEYRRIYSDDYFSIYEKKQ